jgi:glyoxylase-like metal-dependent hydrolase (beta-lactamase superfamily II)
MPGLHTKANASIEEAPASAQALHRTRDVPADSGRQPADSGKQPAASGRQAAAGNVCGVSVYEVPATGSAEVHVLHEGYVGLDGDGERVSGTVTLIVDGGAVIVVDPGMVASRDALLAALASHGPRPADVTDIVFSHHHPDHTVNAALFPNARIHDHWAVYHGDRWIDRDADGYALSPSVRLLRTPGHTAEDISTVASANDGVYVCTHAWWGADGPAIDPRATEPDALKASRERLLSFATVIIPGHGAAFRPASTRPPIL